MATRSIHYLHGHIQEGGTPVNGQIVLARGEFDAAYAPHTSLMNFLGPTLDNDSIVFIGCRLEEPVMPQVFDICEQRQWERLKLMAEHGASANPPKRFILLPRPQTRTAHHGLDDEDQRIIENKEAYYRRMHIEVVWYDAPDKGHSALRRMLERIAHLAPIVPDHGWQGGYYAT